MDFKIELKKRATEINDSLDRLLPPARTYPGIIHEALRYSLFAGGKRLRPALALAAAEVINGCRRDIMPAACSLELIHTYSLIHDDLPAIDNDDLRRGMPTCHKKYGEAIAILAGDALLTMAFELLSMCPVNNSITPERLIKVISEISRAAGVGGLIGGQVVDIVSSSRNIDGSVLEYIHRNKTGAMYRVSVRTGAILSGAADDDLERLTRYADHLGLAFQITDDILDLVGDEKSIGKPVHSDLKNEKATYPSLYGMEKALLMSQEEKEKALEAIEVYDERADFLRELVKFVVKRNH
ncbi:MAG: geranyl transferase [Peptococcaceae bacterium BICA1-7]|nr:MAG: geranyl transferase [Peptococcaceae bacterium BICA1-7]HBV96850.1 polyprenyl synthetase family protein [Desulfotomaculum sp.]